jgi:hypothetical protein
MAFTAELLRELGGFDPAMGVGSATLGGDDLMAFFLAIATGHTLVYQPDALIWHHHHTDERALIAQARGHAVGLGAFLTGVALHHPRMLPLLAARLPRAGGHALRHFHTRSDTAAVASDTASATPATAEDPVALPPAALTAERRGLLYGPFAYLRSTRTVRRARAAAARQPVDRIGTVSPTEARR